MMYLLLSLTMITISIMFSKMIHPLTLGLTLLIQTLNMCIMVGMISKSFWFSFVLFLILLGGMLVLFMYVVSLAPNEKFSLSKKFMMMMMISVFTITTFIFFNDKTTLMTMHLNKEMDNINNMISYMPENSLSLNKLYNPPTYIITMTLIIYLLITLIVIVHITKAFFGPLRTMFNKNK